MFLFYILTESCIEKKLIFLFSLIVSVTKKIQNLFLGIDGILFDMDGVLAHTEPLSCQALRFYIMSKFAIDVGTDFTDVVGKSLKDSLLYYAKMYSFNLVNFNFTQATKEKDEIYFSTASGKLFPSEGLLCFLDWLNQQSINYAIASSGSLKKIEFTLSELHLDEYFKGNYFSSTQVEKGKPFPDLFLYAAKEMKWNPSKIIVIEDSPLGIQAAKGAGMFAIGYTSSFTADVLRENGADLTISSFKDIVDC